MSDEEREEGGRKKDLRKSSSFFFCLASFGEFFFFHFSPLSSSSSQSAFVCCLASALWNRRPKTLLWLGFGIASPSLTFHTLASNLLLHNIAAEFLSSKLDHTQINQTKRRAMNPSISLFRSLLREAKKVDNYNFRLYAIRRVKLGFQINRNLAG